MTCARLGVRLSSTSSPFPFSLFAYICFVGVSPKKKPCLRSDKDTYETNQEQQTEFVGESWPDQHHPSLSSGTDNNHHTGESQSQGNKNDANCQLEQFHSNLDNVGNFVVSDFQNGSNSGRDVVQEKLGQSSRSYQLLSQAEFTDDKIAINNKQRDQIKDKSNKKVDENKSGGPRVEQVTMGNAFGSSSRDTEGMAAAAAAVKTIDRSQFYTEGQDLEHNNNPEETGYPGPGPMVVKSDRQKNLHQVSESDACQQQGGYKGECLQGDDDAGTPVDNTAETQKDDDDDDGLLRSEGAEGKALDNQSPSKDAKDKFNAGKLQLVDKAYEATELICEEPVPLSPIPEAEVEVSTPSPPPPPTPDRNNPSNQAESPVCTLLDESQQTTPLSQSTTQVSYHGQNLPLKTRQESNDTCKFLYNEEETCKKDTEITKASEEGEADIKSQKLEDKDIILEDDSHQGNFKQIDEEISIKTNQGTADCKNTTCDMEKDAALTKVKDNANAQCRDTEITDRVPIHDKSHAGQLNSGSEGQSAGHTTKPDSSTVTNQVRNDNNVTAYDNVISTLSGHEYTPIDKQCGVQGSNTGQDSHGENNKQNSLLESCSKKDINDADDEYEILTDDTLDSDIDMPVKTEDVPQKKGKKKSLSFRAIGSNLRSVFKGKSKSKQDVLRSDISSDIGARLSQSPTSATTQKLSTSTPGNVVIETQGQNEGATNLSHLSTTKQPVEALNKTSSLPEIVVHDAPNGAASKTDDDNEGTEETKTEHPSGSEHLEDPDAPESENPDSIKETSRNSAKRPPVSGSAWSRLQGIGAKKVAQDGASALSSGGSLSSLASDDSLGTCQFFPTKL